MKLTRLGHATLLIETETTRLLIDPGIYSTEWQVVRDLDAVLVTHEHADHFDRENLITLMAANPAAVAIGLAPITAAMGSSKVPSRTIEPGTLFEVGGIQIEGVGGWHALVHRDIARLVNVGYVISESDGPRFFHPGDSHETAPPGIDVLALPLTSPWSTAGATADFLRAIEPEIAFPIHDAALSTTGHAAFMRLVRGLAPAKTELRLVDRLASIDL